MTKAGSRLACSRRSDSRARGKNSRRKKKRGETSREKGGGREKVGESSLALPPPPPILNSLPTYRRDLLSKRLEQARSRFA